MVGSSQVLWVVSLLIAVVMVLLHRRNRTSCTNIPCHGSIIITVSIPRTRTSSSGDAVRDSNSPGDTHPLPHRISLFHMEKLLRSFFHGPPCSNVTPHHKSPLQTVRTRYRVHLCLGVGTQIFSSKWPLLWLKYIHDPSWNLFPDLAPLKRRFFFVWSVRIHGRSKRFVVSQSTLVVHARWKSQMRQRTLQTICSLLLTLTNKRYHG